MWDAQSGVLWTVVSNEFKVATFLKFVTGPVVRVSLKLVLWAGEMHHGGNREHIYFESA